MNGLPVVGDMKAVENVAIIGAGNMGSGIAQKSAQEGFNVQMVDREAQYVAVSYTHLTLPTTVRV